MSNNSPIHRKIFMKKKKMNGSVKLTHIFNKRWSNLLFQEQSMILSGTEKIFYNCLKKMGNCSGWEYEKIKCEAWLFSSQNYDKKKKKDWIE